MSADIVDNTQEIEDRLLSLRVENIRKTTKNLKPISCCNWCREPFEKGSLKVFCDSDCANDYEIYHRK